MRGLLSHSLGIGKAFIAGALSRVIGLKQKYFPSKPVGIRLVWGDQWNAIDDYLSICLRYGIRFENDEQTFLLSFLQKGWTVFDIGAHHGFYTLLASHCVTPAGRVYAFEPSQRERQRLEEHLKLNGRTGVRVEGLALGESFGTQKLFVCQGIETGCNSLNVPLVFEQVKAEEVSVSTLDRFVQDCRVERIDFIKLDVEGAEMSVLKGGAETFKRLAPVMMCELVDRRTQIWHYSSRDVFEFLKSFGYCFFSFKKGGRLATLVPKSDFNENILAVPLKKTALVKAYL